MLSIFKRTFQTVSVSTSVMFSYFSFCCFNIIGSGGIVV